MENVNEHNVNNEESDSPENNSTPGKNDWLKVPFAFIDFEKANTIVERIVNKVEQFENVVLTSMERCKQNEKKLEEYFKIVANCQKQTAEFANNQFEKHALHPAIETVDVLTQMIQQVYKQTTNLSESQTQCPLFTNLIHAITQTWQIAQQKCQSLDIESIEPKPGEDFDPARHEIKNVINTDGQQKHKKVSDVLIPGLLYRGLVLRQAKVSVFRYCENSNP